MLSAEKIQSNWDIFLSNIKTYLSPDRAKALTAFYEQYDNRIALMPASGKSSYHNAFPGGYVDHVNRVLSCALQVADLWKKNGAAINFTTEELAMVAINHDLGKFGTTEAEYYIDNDSDWHIKNRGELYKLNPAIPFMKVQDRSLFILQSIGIILTANEYLGIKLHDGLYDESNKSYLMAYSTEFELKSNLPFIIQQADLMAAKIEKDLFIQSTMNRDVVATPTPSVPSETKKAPEGNKPKSNTGHRILDRFLNE
jgi:hypothetical protein